MKCPVCNYINSDSRSSCKQCGNSFRTKNSIEVTNQVANNLKIKEVPFPYRGEIPKSDLELERLESELARLRQNETLVTTLIDYPESNFDFDSRISEVLNSLDYYIDIYKKNFKIQKTKTDDLKIHLEDDYQELFNRLPHTEVEHELNPFGQMSLNSEVIDDLYNLQLKELNNTQVNYLQTSDIKNSHTRSIDRKSLKDTYHNLQAELLREVHSNSNENLSNSEYEIPSPNSGLIFISFILDFLINLFFSLTLVFTLDFFDSPSDNFQEFFDQELNFNYFLSNGSQIGMLFLTCWIVINFISLTINYSTPGQKSLGLKFLICRGKILV